MQTGKMHASSPEVETTASGVKVCDDWRESSKPTVLPRPGYVLPVPQDIRTR